jgi:hypothetical protein
MMPKHHSPDALPICKIGRDQSAIVKKWWGAKKNKVEQLEEVEKEKRRFTSEIALLEAEKQHLLVEIDSVRCQMLEEDALLREAQS